VDLFAQEKDYFIKLINGECASFIKHINEYTDFIGVSDALTDKGYIIQRRVRQHCELNRLNSHAVNTVRIVTINNGTDPVYVLSSVLRVGTKITGSADNFSIGGLCVGIEPDGQLQKYGFYKPSFGTKTEVHPDTKIKFSDFKIPFYTEAVDTVCRAHAFFYGVLAIGWDVAITENGPVLIEGNDNFGFFLHQIADRSLKKDWESFLK
jgi:hypothetical protein